MTSPTSRSDAPLLGLAGGALRAIEEAAMRAWPAQERIDEAGWVLRFAGGYTRRANCATALAPEPGDVRPRIAWAERHFAARGLPAVFRVVSGAPAAGLDGALAEGGYQRADETLVMTRELAPGPSAGRVRALPLDAWLDLFDGLSGKRGAHRALHRALLDAIPGERLLAAVEADGRDVGCGLAVRDGALVGLFDLAIAPELRGRGHGRRLVEALLAWAEGRGARHAYLQVLATNAPAVRLYRRAGFAEAYRYWYRLPR